MSAPALTIDFSQVNASHDPSRRVARIKANGDLDEREAVRALAPELTDQQLEALKATFTSTGGNVSKTAEHHEVPADLVLRLANDLEWPMYATESAEASHRQHMTKVMNRLEERMIEMADSLEVETKPKEVAASVNSKRELSKYLEPLSSRHSAFKTMFDAWMRLGAILFPEQFANDPDPDNWRAAEQRSQARDMLIVGGLAGIKRDMKDILDRHFHAGIPDRVESETETIDARALESGK